MSIRMDESQAATLAQVRVGRRRPRWLGPGGLLLVLAFLTANVLADGPMIAADRRIRAAVQAQANAVGWRWMGHGAHAPAQLLTQLGNNEVAVPVLVVCALVVAAWHRSVRPLVAAAAGVVLLLAIVTSAKILTDRAGPGLPPVPFGHLGVFPSGHTTTAGVCLGLAALPLAAGLRDRARRAVIVVMVALCFLVGVALVWCDYHWFTDVAAGWALTPLIVMASLRLAGLSTWSGARGPGENTGPEGNNRPEGNSRPRGAVARVAAPPEPARMPPRKPAQRPALTEPAQTGPAQTEPAQTERPL
jgi:membrane-associated phospholipid phosphatase